MSASERSTCLSSQVLLTTVRVKVETTSGYLMIVCALINQESEATFISETLAQTLRVKRMRMPVSISAVRSAKCGAVRHAVLLTISSTSSNSPSFSSTALILNELTSYALRRVSNP